MIARLETFGRPHVLTSRMNFHCSILAVLTATLIAARAATPLEDAVGLYKQKRYPEARAALESIVAAEPNNAAACYQLGMTLMRRGDDKALDDALTWLDKAVKLEPNNGKYLADFGGVSMLLADKNSSIGAARTGRDAMEKALTFDTDNLDAREGLWRFYVEAPVWLGLGDRAKAATQLEEIRKRDPNRANALLLDAKIRTKQFDDGFKICEELLAKNPDDFFALLQYSRVSLASGKNLERGLDHLKKYLTLAETAPTGTNPVTAWVRTGNIHEKLGRPEEARKSYQAALKLSPDDRTAAAALEKLK